MAADESKASVCLAFVFRNRRQRKVVHPDKAVATRPVTFDGRPPSAEFVDVYSPRKPQVVRSISSGCPIMRPSASFAGRGWVFAMSAELWVKIDRFQVAF